MAIDGEGELFEVRRYATRDGWLADRGRHVGGSDVAAILGLSPWATAVDVWADKVGRGSERSTPAMDFGNLMEPHVAEWYRREHPDREVRSVYDREAEDNATLVSLGRPWAAASLDYEVRDPDLGWGVLEIKTAGRERDWDGGVPDHYLAQVTHYMDVTGRPFADVAVFFRDTCEYAEWRVPRDDEDVALVRSRVDSFWHENVEGGRCPEPAGRAGEVASMARVFGSPQGEIARTDDPEVARAIEAYAEAKENVKAWTSVRDANAAVIARAVGGSGGVASGGWTAKWVRREVQRLDAKRLKAEMPDVYERYARKKVESGGLRLSRDGGD